MEIRAKLFRSFTRKPVDCLITTERAESSYGNPVVVVGGFAHGPGDLGEHLLKVDNYPKNTVASECASLAKRIHDAGFNIDDFTYGGRPRWIAYQPNAHEDDE